MQSQNVELWLWLWVLLPRKHWHLGSVHIATGKLGQKDWNVKGQHAPTENNQRQKYVLKTHLLLWILAVIGGFEPYLTIVMIFVTQNNFKNGTGISNRLLGFSLLL